MVRLIEHGRAIFCRDDQQLIVQLRRPIHAPIVRGIEVSGISYKSGNRPSPTLETRGDLESWARNNGIPIMEMNAPLVAIADALNSIPNNTEGPTLVHLNYGRVQYAETPDKYSVSLNTDLYLPHEGILK